MFAILILFVVFHSSTAAIHKLNDSDYARMPPLFHLDNYEECFDEPDAIYCATELLLVSDEPSELLTMIKEYAAYHTHYNRTLLRHGYCMKKSCKKFYNVSQREQDLKLPLEACINDTLYNNYKLKAKVSGNYDCSKRDRDQPIEYLDIAMAIICLVIVMANIIGSLCDLYLEKDIDRGALRYLLWFSAVRNWKKFIAQPGDGQDPRVKALKGINGFRALTMVGVVVAHAGMIGALYVTNPHGIEAAYEKTLYNTFANGTLVMQTFLVISAFLLVYNWMIHLETHRLSWMMLPQHIIMRWLRLTPAYALILGLTVTWFGRLGTGPWWKEIVYTEIRDCRADWWKHLFYINNYYYEGSTCMPQTWYLAADTQLYTAAVIIFLILRTNLTRKVGLSLLLVAGMIIPTLHVYFQHLNGTLVLDVEMVLSYFTKDPTFNMIFKRGHTNLSGYVIGMALGYLIYYWQQRGGDPTKFRKYRFWYWSTFVLGLIVMYSGSIFYQGVQRPIYIHMLYAAFMKPAFGLVIAILLAGVVIQFEGLYRPIFEWQPFLYMGRLSYSVYLIHIAFIRTEAVSIIATQRMDENRVVIKSCSYIIATFIGGFFFYIMVESPCGNLVRDLFRKPKSHNKEDSKAEEGTKKIEEQNEKGTEVNDTKMEDGAIVIKMGSKI